MNNTLTYEELETVLIEVENVINNRPLTYFDTDSTEDILTPNHLIYGRSLPIANRELQEQPINGQKPKFKKRVLYKQKVLRDFRKRWETEYLASLRATQQIPKTKQLRVPSVGDVVLVHGDSPRLSWRLGCITELHQSGDGVVRSATVRMSRKKGDCSIVQRSIKVLYPLEENCIEISESKDDNGNDAKTLQRKSNEGLTVNDTTESVACTDESIPCECFKDIVESETATIEGDEHRTSGRPRRIAAVRGELRRLATKQQ